MKEFQYTGADPQVFHEGPVETGSILTVSDERADAFSARPDFVQVPAKKRTEKPREVSATTA